MRGSAMLASLAAARLAHLASPSLARKLAAARLRNDLESHPFWVRWLESGAAPFAPGFLGSANAEPSRFATRAAPILARSTGTENPEALFPLSKHEAAAWGACAWGFAQSHAWLGLRPRVALVLKNDSDMYRGASTRLSFHKLPADARRAAQEIAETAPDAIAGPAEALRRIALRWPSGRAVPKIAICGAEMLWPDQSRDMRAAWPGAVVSQFYQCAEGLLGHGDESTISFQSWSGAIERRSFGRYFSPVRTDFWRRASPVVRAEISDALEEMPGGRVVHHGRASHLFETASGVLVSSRGAFEDLFRAHGSGLGRWMQAVQLADGSVAMEAEQAAASDGRFERDCAQSCRAAGLKFAGLAVLPEQNMLDAKTSRGRREIPRTPPGVFCPAPGLASLFGAAP